MAIDPFIEHPEPEPESPGSGTVADTLEAQAHAALEHWLRESPGGHWTRSRKRSAPISI